MTTELASRPTPSGAIHPLPIRVLLIDDHKGIRAGLRRRINRETDLTVVGEAADGRAALALIQTTAAEVVLLDIEMPHMSGLEVVERLYAAPTPVSVLGLSSHARTDFLFSMLAHGAAGYLSKDDPTLDILSAIRAVAGGTRCRITPRLLTRLSRGNSSSTPLALTVQERLILRHIGRGYPNALIADTTRLPRTTIDAIEQRTTEALGLSDRTALVAWCWHHGLATP